MSATATPQHLAALAHGNAIRIEGARLRRELSHLPLGESRRRAAELLRNPPEALTHMRIGTFLSGIHRFGPARVKETLLLSSLYGAWNRPIGYRRSGGLRPLTERERLSIAAVLEGES